MISNDLLEQVKAHEDSELGPPAGTEAISAVEEKLGVALSPSHRQFLSWANGGVVGFVQVFGVDCEGSEYSMDLIAKVSQMRPHIEGIEEGKVLPFGADWGGNYLCFDLTKRAPDGEYPVLYWCHEFSEEPEDAEHLWSKVGDNFSEFLKWAIET
jgi:cell wall assembly regulator SMI1